MEERLHLMIKKIPHLFLIVLILTLIFPQPAQADILGAIDFLDHLTESLEDITQPLMYQFIRLIIIYAVSAVSLGVSSLLLQHSINSQEAWLTALKPMIESGWSFTSGLANMILVLVFLIIALAYILKIETFQAKKALPQLIIVAFLLNFSWLFVRMMFDLSQIFYNTVLIDQSIFLTVMDVFITEIVKGVLSICAILIGIIAAWSIPMAHPFAQIASTALFASFFLPQFISVFFQIFCALSLTSIFIIFTFLFVSRVFIISILAILAPLAFVFLILPQTKKWWDEWLKNLTEWLVLGIFFLFFLILGFKSLGLLVPKITDVPSMLVHGVPWLDITGYLFYHLAIFVYMTVLLYIGKKYVPTLSGELIAQGKALGGFILTRGMKPLGRAMWKQAGRGWRQHLEERPEALERWTKWGMGEAPGKGKYLPVGIQRWVGRALGPALIEARKADIAKTEDGAEKIKTPDLLESKFLSAKTDEERIGYLSAAIKKGGPFKKAFEKKYADQAILLATKAYEMQAIPEAERIAMAFLHMKEKPEEREVMLKNIGFKFENDAEKEKYHGSLTEKMLREAKVKDIPIFDKSLWGKKGIQEITHNFWTGEKVGFAGREFHEDFLAPFQAMVSEKENEDPEWYAKNNPSLYRYLTGSAAQNLGVGLTARPITKKRLGEIAKLRTAERKLDEINSKILTEQPAIAEYLTTQKEVNQAQKEIKRAEKEIEGIRTTIMTEIEKHEVPEETIKKERGQAIKEARRKMNNLKKTIGAAEKEQEERKKIIETTPELKKTWQEIEGLQKEIKGLKESQPKKEPTKRETEEQIRKRIREERPPAGLV